MGLADERTSVRWAELISKHFRSLPMIPAKQVYLFIQQNALTTSHAPGTMPEPVTYKEICGLRKPRVVRGNK